MVEILLWIGIFIIIYAYIGYTLLLIIIVSFKKIVSFRQVENRSSLPDITILIAAYNERNILDEKITNCRELNYPSHQLKIAIITDGSDDGSEIFLKKYPNIEVYHQWERMGKTAAINRAMPFIQTPIVVFSDANALLNKDALMNLTAPFSNPLVGCVAGEKRVISTDKDQATNTGESFYWNYESFIKFKESQLQSTIGAAGELYALRTHLYQAIPNDTILDDFTTSTITVLKGYSIKYAPNAYSIEKGSPSIHDEMKRKVRIAAGGFQMLSRYPNLLNPFCNGWFSIQFISHKFLRWAIVPFIFILVFILNGIIIVGNSTSFYITLFGLQCSFYLFGLLGFLLRDNKLNFKILFLPFYIITMNASQILGLIKFVRGKQSARWDKIDR